MKIRLNEIPDEGRQYTYDRKTGELTPQLKDMVGEHDYSVDLYLRPLGTGFEMRGSIKTCLDEICSRCGYEFELPITRSVNEILIEDETDYRKVSSAGGNQSVDFLNDGPAMLSVRGSVFDPGDFVHEAIALAEPFYPTCGPNGECLHQDEVSQVISRLEAESELIEEQKPTGHPGFEALQNLKLRDPRKKN